MSQYSFCNYLLTVLRVRCHIEGQILYSQWHVYLWGGLQGKVSPKTKAHRLTKTCLFVFFRKMRRTVLTVERLLRDHTTQWTVGKSSVKRIIRYYGVIKSYSHSSVCFQKKVGKCGKCRRPAEGKILRVSEDVVYHPDCFTCSVCNVFIYFVSGSGFL